MTYDDREWKLKRIERLTEFIRNGEERLLHDYYNDRLERRIKEDKEELRKLKKELGMV